MPDRLWRSVLLDYIIVHIIHPASFGTPSRAVVAPEWVTGPDAAKVDIKSGTGIGASGVIKPTGTFERSRSMVNVEVDNGPDVNRAMRPRQARGPLFDRLIERPASPRGDRGAHGSNRDRRA